MSPLKKIPLLHVGTNTFDYTFIPCQ